jgi:hypothetical protein
MENIDPLGNLNANLPRVLGYANLEGIANLANLFRDSREILTLITLIF